MEKYETDFKHKVVKRFPAGDGGAKLLARRWSAPEEKIRTCVSRYQMPGLDGLRPMHIVYSAQQPISSAWCARWSYKKVSELGGVDLSAYRGKSREAARVTVQ